MYNHPSTTCLLIILFMMSYLGAIGQVEPVVCYDFDNMDLSERTGNYNTGTAINTAQFECGSGPNSMALLFEGGPLDTIELDPQIKDIFNNANTTNTGFTLSFDFWIDEGSGSYSLFSIEDNCLQDSALIVRYIQSLNEIRIQYARDASESVFFSEKLDVLSCWHNLTLVKDGDDFTFYLDGVFIESLFFNDIIVLGQDYKVYIGFSDCVPRLDEDFRGRIDDIKIYDVPLDEQDLAAVNKFTDQIISIDTTIFEGDSYQLVSGPSCASDITWSPTLGLSDAGIPGPNATPTESTIYKISYDHGSCITTDSVRISVIKESNIDCNNILLPKAFTPNGDRLNDVYSISNNFIIEDLSRFEVYDRWGGKIFETTNKLMGWDGTFRGQKMMPGTYVYKIEYKCKEESYQKTASFSLLK